MDKIILIDAGSFSLKAAFKDGENIIPIRSLNYPFKKDLDSDKGLSPLAKEQVISFVQNLQKEFPDCTIKIFATALYRKFSSAAKQSFVGEFLEETGVAFNIISHDDENFYLEKALIGKSTLDEPVLLINIGGGSTELVVVKNGQTVERHNVDFGVGTINTAFDSINNPISGVSLREVVSWLLPKLPKLASKVEKAFYSGGELRYMEVAGYPLRDNLLFEDSAHPKIIGVSEFERRNEEVFSQVQLSLLESLMSDNPTWMHGARGCSALAQAIAEKYNLKILIPSNSNLLDGVARQELPA